MQSPSFSSLYEKLNPGQRTAVDTIEGPVMVVAGPGTGKTQVLTLRIANILANTQVNPENILALTFTESAVHEMRNRLVSIIGTPGYRAEITTFHGFCNDIIQTYSEEFGALISSEAITDLEQIRLIEAIIDRGSYRLLRPSGDPAFYLGHILRAINELKKEGVTPEALADALERQDADFLAIEDLYHEKGAHKGKMKGTYVDLRKRIDRNRELQTVYAAYQARLREMRQYDFNDMLLETIRVLESNDGLLLQLQERYQYVLVDEHQDTNTAQNRIVELICSFYAPNPNLFVVGDEKQAIFRFQGASLENFLYFKTLYPAAVLISLQENYRSSQTILDAAGSLISFNARTGKLLPGKSDLHARAGHKETPVAVAPFSDFYAEYHYVADDIEKRIRDGAAAGEIAVLARNNRDLTPLADILDQKGIPFALEADQNALNDIEIQKLVQLFRAIYAIGDDDPFVRAMHIECLEIHPLDIYRLNEYARRHRTTLWETITSGTYKGDIALLNEETVTRFAGQVARWKTKSENSRFDDVFVSVLHESCFLQAILRKAHATELVDKVTALFEDVRFHMNRNRNFSLRDFLEYLDLLEQHKLPLRNSRRTIARKAVNLMTAHKSKGLEFDYVYIINAFDGHWGNARKRGQLLAIPWEYLTVKLDTVLDDERNEDERRLFYVALTRARKEVTVSYASRGLDGKEQIPSQFLSEIASEFLHRVDTTDFDERFLANKEIILKPRTSETGTDIRQIYWEHKDYFSELFVRKGLSVSGLNNYLHCPWRYFFRNLLGLPEVKSEQQMFGTAIHEALDKFVRRLGGPVRPDGAFLAEQFSLALDRQPMNKKEHERAEERGRALLTGYYEYAAKDWHAGMTSELDIRGVKLDDGIFLNGKLDMVEKRDDHGTVRVYDFKTGRPKSRNEIEGKTKDATGDYKRQIVFYKLLLDRYLPGRMNMTEGVIAFVEPDAKGQYRSESFTVEPEELQLLEQAIRAVAGEIVSLAFWDRECDDAECEYCKLRRFIQA